MIFDEAYAASYEAERSHKPGWQLEARAVAAMLGPGPVLDCPVGTGHFIPLYQGRGLSCTGIDLSMPMLRRAAVRYSGVPLVVGDLTRGLPFPDHLWGSAVCIRLIPWLTPPQVDRAIAELGRLAGVVILSARVGMEGQRCRRGSYTHSLRRLLNAARSAGLTLSDTAVTADTEVGQFLVMRLRG